MLLTHSLQRLRISSMKSLFLGFTLLLSFSALADEVKCKTLFNLGTYKKNLLGELVRKQSKKMDNSIRVDTFGVGIPVNNDGSAFFTSSSHIDGDLRLSTHYRTIKQSNGDIQVSLNFSSQGQPLLSQVDMILGPVQDVRAELTEPLLYKKEGKVYLMLESVSYRCEALK